MVPFRDFRIEVGCHRVQLSEIEAFGSHDDEKHAKAGYSDHRLGLLAMLFYGSAEHTADSLKKHGTGFDLIVGAQELAGASERTVDGRRLPPAPLPLYKTSTLRMQEALAVSYRRQAEKVKLAEGARVNMTA
eukprot:jgi/Tetstr1/428572/TSEL_018566.t1